MKWIEAVILGAVQGLTEFLPVSSSGHLILLQMAVGEPSLFFNVMLHAGTLAAVLVVYRKQLAKLIRHPINSDLRWYVLASIPTAVIAFLAKLYLPEVLLGSWLAFGFMLTTVALVSAEFLSAKTTNNIQTSTLSVKSSLLTGIFQGIAVLPGASRSGLTISALLCCGVERTKAAEFSFLLSVPIILASVAAELYEFRGAMNPTDILPVLLGTAVAFFVGLFAVRFMLRVVRSKSFLGFAVYTFVLAVAILVVKAVRIC